MERGENRGEAPSRPDGTEPRDAKLPLAAALSTAVIAIVASYIGMLGGIGNPEPGQLRTAELTLCAIAGAAIVGVVLASIGARNRPLNHRATLAVVVAVTLAALGAFLVFPFPVGNGLARSDAGFGLLAATPLASLLVARRSPGRSAWFVLSAAIGSIAYLTQCVVAALLYL